MHTFDMIVATQYTQLLATVDMELFTPLNVGSSEVIVEYICAALARSAYYYLQLKKGEYSRKTFVVFMKTAKVQQCCTDMTFNQYSD